MLTKLAEDCECRLARFYEIIFANEFIIFEDFPTKQAAFVYGQPAPYNQLLLQHLRSWDYPEIFAIYSQLDRKIKTWFFTFLSMYVS